MMKKVIDQQQRESALDPNGSFIVQAPAGSGKTELLIQRYLLMLSQVDAPEEIIAITFTRKAASEMRNRVLNALEERGAGTGVRNDSASLTERLAASVLEKDREKKWNLLDNPVRLRIQTIDSLTANLTRQMPLLSRFGAQPETISDATEMYRSAAANTIQELDGNSEWSDSVRILLQHMDNDLPRTRDLLASMLARREQWLRHIVKEHPREALESAIQKQIEDVLQYAKSVFPTESEAEFIDLIRYAAENLSNPVIQKSLLPCLESGSLLTSNDAELELWKALCSLLLTSTGSWRKVSTAAIGFPAAGKGPGREERSAMKDRFANLLSKLSENDELLEAFLEIQLLPGPHYRDDEWEVLAALHQLLKLAAGQLRVLFAENNQMDFCGITEAAREALGSEDEPTDLALQLDYRIQHILVDEFQDISINQYVLLAGITAGWSDGDGHSLFLVGDPMQSIYRFREAEVSIFTNCWKNKRFAHVTLVPLAISVNFRSMKGIVDWVNGVFKEVLPDQADEVKGAVGYAAATAYHEGTSDNPVNIHASFENQAIEEARKVSEIIKRSINEDNEQSIAILVRNRSHLVHIIPALVKSGINYQAVEIEEMGQRAAVQDLLSLTMALTHFSDRVAWLSVLRAPWCGMSLKDLEIIAASRDRQLWDSINDKDVLLTLSRDGQLRLEHFLEVINAAFISRGRKSLSRWVESIWLCLGGPACIQDESDLQNSKVYFQLLADFDHGGILDKRDVFFEQVAGLFARPASQNDSSVQLMTIHKSKGLEFDTVILPGLARGSATDPGSLLMWMEIARGDHQDLLLAPIKSSGKEDSLMYNYLRHLEKQKQRYELGRLLYVASTRAKQRLHLMVSVEPGKDAAESRFKRPPSDSLLAQLWPVIQEEIELVPEYSNPPEVQEDSAWVKPKDQLCRLSADWTRPAPVVSLQQGQAKKESRIENIEYDWAGETIRHTGTVVHRAIQWMSEGELSSIDAATIRSRRGVHERQLLSLGVPRTELPQAVEQVELALLNMIDDDRARWILSLEHSKSKNEYALSGVYRGDIINVVLDRTFVDSEGVCWVIDYKSSRHEGSDRDNFLDQQCLRYKEQLEKYGRLMHVLEKKPVRLGLYFPLMKGWREWSLEVDRND